VRSPEGVENPNRAVKSDVMASRIVLEECDILTNTFIFIDHVTANDRNRIIAGQYELDLEIGALEKTGCERVLTYETVRAKSE
jgi:hypothetical protein